MRAMVIDGFRTYPDAVMELYTTELERTEDVRSLVGGEGLEIIVESSSRLGVLERGEIRSIGLPLGDEDEPVGLLDFGAGWRHGG